MFVSRPRGKKIIERLGSERIFLYIKLSRAFLSAKQVEEKRRKD